MAPGSGSHQTNPFPIRSAHPSRRSSPYPSNPPTNGRSSPFRHGFISARATPAGIRGAQSSTSHPLQDQVTTLIVALNYIKAGLKGAPPVQLALDSLEECLIHTLIWEQNRREHDEIMTNLTSQAVLLQSRIVKENRWSLTSSISNVARAIGEQTSVIRMHQDWLSLEQLSIGQDDVQSVPECYRKIGTLFRQLHADLSLGIWDVAEDQQMRTRLNDLHPAGDAYHNAALSSSVTKRTGCTEGTRVELLNTTQTWIQDQDAAKIYWLNGMAGTGKTTIAYSVCEMLLEKHQLGGSFFCSRNSPDCRDVHRIVPTIAYQLGHYSKPYRKILCDVLTKDPDVVKRNIGTQFKQLISGPLTETSEAMPADVVVVIDALDECTDADGTRDVLSMLLQYAGDLPIKFFVSSRPEPGISEYMVSRGGTMRSIMWLHDIEQSLVQADIKLYLAEALAYVHLSPSEIDQLAARAGCLFIFAATAVRYILPSQGSTNRRERLRAILGLQSSQPNRSHQEIDELYGTILSNALDEMVYEETELRARRHALWTVICAQEPLSVLALGELLDIPDVETVQLMIQPLQSVLHVSEGTNVISTLHASFPDFLLDRRRAGPFHCNEAAHNSYLAECCFNLMSRSLKFNICDIKSSYEFDEGIQGLQDQISQQITTALFYSCRYWGDHLTRNQPTPPSLLLLESFLQRHLLFWIEVLNLKGVIGHGDGMLSQVFVWLPTQNENTKLRDFTYDARNFLTTFAGNPTSLSTPHLYISTLPFTSHRSLVYRTYWPRTQRLIRVEGTGMEARGKSALATWWIGASVTSLALSNDGKHVVSGSYPDKVSVWEVASGSRILGPLNHGVEQDNNSPWLSRRGSVKSVAYSPDGTRVASGSSGFDNDSIRIWHAQTGEPIALFHYDHGWMITSVAFSPGGAHLAATSYGEPIRIWDTHSGAPVGEPLAGHQGGMIAISFSPDGQHLASGSPDSTIWVWDWLESGVAQGQLEGHTDAVYSVAYSSDGHRLASGSEDRTVRVWDMSDGTLLAGPFEGHADTVSSVAFSPNGTRVVSGSHDKTIRVWEALSGTLVAGPFEGHDENINVVLFTADGTRILSGSDDDTIRVWDALHETSGATKSSGHTGSVNSVALSPDGTRVASGSEDETICVWDTHNGVLVAGPFMGHTGEVYSVAFSPDGARIASGSDDYTLRTWDASTGSSLAGPIEGHSDYVRLVAFSPDGSQIVSCSKDGTIRLWNSHTGESIAKPFEGHTHYVTSIAFSPDGTRVVSGSYYDTVRMWDADNGITLWGSRSHTNTVRCVAVSPDGTRVVSGSDDKTILVLDARDGAVLHGPLTGHTSRVYSVAFSPDGTRVVSGSEDQTVRVWDVESGTTVAGPLKGHRDAVYSAAFSPDGARIISGSADRTIRVWDLAAVAQASPLDYWSIDDDGWLTNSNSQRLFWVPSDLRLAFGILTASNPIVMNASWTTRSDLSTLLVGNRWHECSGRASVVTSS